MFVYMVESAPVLIVVVALALVVNRPMQELLGKGIQTLSSLGSRHIHGNHEWTGEETYD